MEDLIPWEFAKEKTRVLHSHLYILKEFFIFIYLLVEAHAVVRECSKDNTRELVFSYHRGSEDWTQWGRFDS